MNGAVSLFDGKTLTGWHKAPRTYSWMPPEQYRRAAETSGQWEVHDGAIVGGQEIGGWGGYLVSDDTYADFELVLEAWPDWPADTGILVRATPAGSEGFQILLDHRKSGNIGGFFGNFAGGFHAVTHTLDARYDRTGRPIGLVEEDPAASIEPATADKQALLSYDATAEEFLDTWKWNDWNQIRIRCQGAYPVLTVWINDIKISELDTGAVKRDGYDPAAVATLLGRAGHIALEVHDNDPYLGDARWGRDAVCRWRNMHLRRL